MMIKKRGYDMHYRIFAISGILLTAVISLLTSCNHKDIYVENFNLYQTRIDFDFSQVSEQPEAMRVHFYPMGALEWHQPYTFDLSATGGVVSLPAGDYRILSYNVDAKNVMESQEVSYADYCLTTPSYMIKVTEEQTQSSPALHRSLFGSKVPIADGEQAEYRLYDSPDWTCCCREERFRVDPVYEELGQAHTAEVSDEIRSSLTLQAEEAVKKLEFELSGIEGVQWASLIRGTISGLPASRNMATGLPSSDLGLMTFAAHVDLDREAIVGSMNVWGFYPSGKTDVEQYIDIYLWTNAGNYFLTQNVTEQMRSGQQQQRIVLRLTSSLDIMDAAMGDSGFKPSVGEWDEVNTGVKL